MTRRCVCCSFALQRLPVGTGPCQPVANQTANRHRRQRRRWLPGTGLRARCLMGLAASGTRRQLPLAPPPLRSSSSRGRGGTAGGRLLLLLLVGELSVLPAQVRDYPCARCTVCRFGSSPPARKVPTRAASSSSVRSRGRGAWAARATGCGGTSGRRIRGHCRRRPSSRGPARTLATAGWSTRSVRGPAPLSIRYGVVLPSPTAHPGPGL